MKPVIIIAIAFVFLFVPTTAYGAEGYFEYDYGKQVSRPPTVCIFQPDDSRIDEQRWNRWYSEMKFALDTWRSILNQSGDGNWDITTVNVPLDKLDLLNFSKCDITVQFVDKPYLENGEYANALGWWRTGNITIVYSEYEFCGKEYFSEYKIMINKYCFGNNIERPKLMASVLQHEFGHAIGMGHFVSYSYVSMQNWYDYGIGYPSIMTPMPPNEELKEITQIDIIEVREIYGERGFGKKINFPAPVFNEPVIPEPIIPVADLRNIYVSGNSETTTISGNVPDKLFKRGTFLEIIIQKPDGSIESKATTVSKTYHKYEYPLTFGSSSQVGMYEISLKFDGTVFEKIPINVIKESSTPNIINELPTEIQERIPEWLKNNAKWWAEGQIDDDSFIQGIQFLIKEGIMTISSTEQKTVGSDNEIPSWVRNNAKWWAEGQISEGDFVRGIEYLVEKRILNVN